MAVRGGAQDHQATGRLEGRRRQDGDLGDRLRAVGAAAHRHVRRGGAHRHGAARLRGADRGPHQDAARVLLRRHGRISQGAGQRAQQGHACRPPRQAAVGRARPFQQRVYELRCAQQRAPAPLPRPVRLRLRVPVGHRVLQGRPLRRHAYQDARGLRQGDGHHPADLGARAARHLLTVPADLAEDRQGAAGADGGAQRQEGHRRLHRSRHEGEGGDAGDGRARQGAVEGGLGAALDRAQRRLRDVRQGPDRFGDAVVEDLPGARRHAAGELHLRAVPGSGRQPRSPSRRATASLSRSGSPTPRPRACPCSCSRSRRRPSGSTST